MTKAMFLNIGTGFGFPTHIEELRGKSAIEMGELLLYAAYFKADV